MKLINRCNHINKPLVFVRNIYGDEIYHMNARSIWKCSDCNKIFYKNYLFEQGEVSDGYHTFNELYHHRAVLFSVICSQFRDIAWKSRQHKDGSMYNGMFIVGIDTPDGPATYHYDINPYWCMFDVCELDRAPEWDGHTPAEAIERIGKLAYIKM